MCFFETVVEVLADLFDVDDGALVTILTFCFCPPTAGVFLLAFWFVEEVCSLVDVVESK